PYDCLNANLHGAEMLMASYRALADVYGQRINLLLHAACRAVEHTLPLQHETGYFPYRANAGITINYTAMVTWCLLNLLDWSPEPQWGQTIGAQQALHKAGDFLIQSFDPQTGLNWQQFESS